jgi:hypothetical protein
MATTQTSRRSPSPAVLLAVCTLLVFLCGWLTSSLWLRQVQAHKYVSTRMLPFDWEIATVGIAVCGALAFALWATPKGLSWRLGAQTALVAVAFAWLPLPFLHLASVEDFSATQNFIAFERPWYLPPGYAGLSIALIAWLATIRSPVIPRPVRLFLAASVSAFVLWLMFIGHAFITFT